MAPRVGFRGLGKYQELKLAELDDKADKLANRIDAAVAKGSNAIDAHHKALDTREREIAEFEKAATDLSNGAPPLSDSEPLSDPLTFAVHPSDLKSVVGNADQPKQVSPFRTAAE